MAVTFQVRAFTTHGEDPSVFPTTTVKQPMATCSSSSRASDGLFWPPQAPQPRMHIPTPHTGTHRYTELKHSLCVSMSERR